MITVIVPHARPEFTANLLANFRRQRGVEAQLLVVENGDAVGSMSSEDATVICSGVHQADAMNAGLKWLRANGGGAWARFDDDDYYGPDYLAEVERSLGPGVTGVNKIIVVSGMPWRFVMLDDGLHKFQGAGEFTGGTHACNVANVPLFPRRDGEDLEWCKLMRERGARLVQREPWGYCYDRTTRAAQRCIWGGSVVTRRAFGASLFYGPHALSAVDYPGLEPLCAMPVPSLEELSVEVRGEETTCG
jgi:hypothetical protein